MSQATPSFVLVSSGEGGLGPEGRLDPRVGCRGDRRTLLDLRQQPPAKATRNSARIDNLQQSLLIACPPRFGLGMSGGPFRRVT